jgi:cell surface protein SprA
LNISNVSKTGSESALARYTLDNTTFSYVFNTTERRSPEYLFQDNWNFSGALQYSISFRNTRLLEPFAFLDEIPLLNALSGLKLGYTPASISASAGLDREYDERQRRVFGDTDAPALQQSHSFSYNTNFGFGYNLTPSINTSFQSRAVFDLSRAGIEPNGVPGTTDSTRFRVVPTFEVFDGLITDTLSSRRLNYEEGYTAGWQPRLNTIEPLSWISYSANYGGGYQWRNSALGSGLGSTISNNLSLNQSLTFDIRDLLSRMGWYNRLLDARQNNEGPSARQDSTSGEQDLGRSLLHIGRESLLALLSIQSLDVAFNISKNSLQSGYAGDSQIYYMFNRSGSHYSPPFSYRTGFIDEIDRSRLISNSNVTSSIQLPSYRNISDDLTVTSRLEPFENFSVDLAWNTQWDIKSTRSVTLDPDESFTTIRTQGGNINSSVWAFGGGYGNLFRSQLQTAFDDIRVQSDSLSDISGNQDGRTVLGKRTLEEDFKEAYLGIGTASLGRRGFSPIPMPGWRVTWSGLEDAIPYLGNFMARASLTHAYAGFYRVGWVYNADVNALPPLQLGAYTVVNPRPKFEPNAISVEKRYSPLLGLNITWLSNLRTTIQYDYSKVSSLALTNTTITERLSRGIRLSLNYTVRDFKIPFFPRIENAVDFTINANYIEDTEQKFILASDLDNALRSDAGTIVRNADLYDFSRSFRGGQSRFNGSAIIGYQFSQTINANFEYTYSRLIPKSTGIYPRTDHDLRFNVVVSIRSN